jgi:hypothetical protein
VSTDQERFDELCYYTLAHGDSSFIHQHVVDAFAAQTISEFDKPIKLTFSLVGLYLHVEKLLTGKQVQEAHMRLARTKQTWPTFVIPATRGSITVDEVVDAAPGPERDQMIHRWCESVWAAYCGNRDLVIKLLNEQP